MVDEKTKSLIDSYSEWQDKVDEHSKGMTPEEYYRYWIGFDEFDKIGIWPSEDYVSSLYDSSGDVALVVDHRAYCNEGEQYPSSWAKRLGMTVKEFEDFVIKKLVDGDFGVTTLQADEDGYPITGPWPSLTVLHNNVKADEHLYMTKMTLREIIEEYTNGELSEGCVYPEDVNTELKTK